MESAIVGRESEQEIPVAELIMKIVDLFESRTVLVLLLVEQEDVKLVSVNFGGEQADVTIVVVMVEQLLDEHNEGDNFIDTTSFCAWDADDFDEYAVIVEDVSSSPSPMTLSLSKLSHNGSSSFSDASLIVFNTRASYKTDVDVVKLCAFAFSLSIFLHIVTLVVLVDAITEDALVINILIRMKKWHLVIDYFCLVGS